MAGSCEHGKEPSGSIKGGKFIAQLSDYQLFKKGSAPRRVQQGFQCVIQWSIRIFESCCFRIFSSVVLTFPQWRNRHVS